MDIQIENLFFSYSNKTQVLNDISMSTNAEVVAIVGVSGCGKSTLLRIISGNLSKDKSSMLMGDISIDGLTPMENTRLGNVAFMFQEATLFPNLTVFENVILPLKIKGIRDKEFALELIRKVGLIDFKDYLPSQLSGGMKTRVSLARTFVTRPKLILLDEPFGALDLKWKSSLYKELETLRKEFEATIIMVTHDITEALLLSNDIYVLGETGGLLDKVTVSKSLPRVFNENSVFALENEYMRISDLIINQS